MHAESERDLKAAFMELHWRRREEAPPFAAMRENAVRRANGPRRTRLQISIAWRLASTAALVCVLFAAMRLVTHSPDAAPRPENDANRAARVDTLLAAIEQHVKQAEADPFTEYPTDQLLAGNEYNFPQ